MFDVPENRRTTDLGLVRNQFTQAAFDFSDPDGGDNAPASNWIEEYLALLLAA